MESAHWYEKVSTSFRDMVRAPVEHNNHRGHHIMGEPLTSRHDFGRNHHMWRLILESAI